MLSSFHGPRGKEERNENRTGSGPYIFLYLCVGEGNEKFRTKAGMEAGILLLRPEDCFGKRRVDDRQRQAEVEPTREVARVAERESRKEERERGKLEKGRHDRHLLMTRPFAVLLQQLDSKLGSPGADNRRCWYDWEFFVWSVAGRVDGCMSDVCWLNREAGDGLAG